MALFGSGGGSAVWAYLAGLVLQHVLQVLHHKLTDGTLGTVLQRHHLLLGEGGSVHQKWNRATLLFPYQNFY